MKTKIFNALKQAYSNLGLGDEVLQEHAGALVATGVITEENIATVVQGQKAFLSSIQTTLDKARTDRTKADKEAKEKADREAAEAAAAAKGVEPTQAEIIAKAVADAVKPFADKLTGFETQSATEKRTAEIMAKAKEYGIPDFLTNNLKIAEDTDLDTFFKDTKQGLVNRGFQETLAPETSEQRIAKEGEDIANMITTRTKEFINDQKK